MTTQPKLRFPAVRPELPSPELWRPYLDEAYAANWFTNFGALSRRLEARMATDWGFAETRCVLAANATVALAAPLIAGRIEGPVLIPAFTFPATASAVRMAGARPVLVDVSAESWRLDPESLTRELARQNACGVILLAPFGLRCDFSREIAAARRFGARVIIDNAAGLGVTRAAIERDPEAFEVYSLHATKPFGIGEGGVIFANALQEAALRAALNFGQPGFGAEGGPTWGLNGKMTEMQAAVGLAAADLFEDRLRRRRAFAARYIALLSAFEGLQFPRDPETAAWQLFPVLMPTEASVERAVETARHLGVELRRYYRPALSHIVPGAQQCPAAEDLAARMVCLPVYSVFSGDEREALVTAVMTALHAAIGEDPNWREKLA